MNILKETASKLRSARADQIHTLEFIKHAHSGQKYGSKPYWTHPEQVMKMAKIFFGSKFTSDVAIISLLHDVVEDTKYKISDLREMGYNENILVSVALLTKDKNISYEANIDKIIHSGNRDAMMVKYCDNFVNFYGDKSSWTPEKREKSQTKYCTSLNKLGKILGVRSDYTVDK